MKILNEEHFQNVKRYAESIGDTSLQNCLDRLKKWEENPDHPSPNGVTPAAPCAWA